MKYYHGSIVPNLKVLHPFNTGNSLSDKACVYLTRQKELALFYIWVRKFMWLTYGFNKEGKVVFMETHKDALKEFYANVKGYIYEAETEEYDDNDTNIKSAVTVYDAVKITRCETVENVYDKIMEYERQGRIIIKRYEELTKAEHKRNEQMILSELKNDTKSKDAPLFSYIKMTFPKLYEKYENDIINK